MSVPQTIQPNLAMGSEYYLRKDAEVSKKQCCNNLRHSPNIFLEKLRKPTKILGQESISPGRDLNPGASECKIVLTTGPRRSIA
jgi:hypothetical protein